MVEAGAIILLNGTSSAGKSSIARALLPYLPAPALHSGIDHFLARTAPGFVAVLPAESTVAVSGLAALFGPEGQVGVRIGPLGYRLLAGMYRAAAALAEAGVAVVLDDVIHDPTVLRSAVTILAPYRPLFVGVQCPLAVAEARERARGDRALGGARTFHALVHTHGCYDVEIDSARVSPEEAAAQIAAALSAQQVGAAFATLAARYAGAAGAPPFPEPNG